MYLEKMHIFISIFGGNGVPANLEFAFSYLIGVNGGWFVR